MYRVARNPAAGARGPAGAAAHFFAPPLCGVWWCLFVFPLLSFARPTSLHRLCAECGGAFLFALSYPLCGPLLCTAFVRSVVVPFCLPSLILCAAHFFAPPVRGVWWCLAVCLVPCCVYVLDSRRRTLLYGINEQQQKMMMSIARPARSVSLSLSLSLPLSLLSSLSLSLVLRESKRARKRSPTPPLCTICARRPGALYE